MPKRRFTQKMHGATSQKTAFFIVTAMNTKSYINKHFAFSGRPTIVTVEWVVPLLCIPEVPLSNLAPDSYYHDCGVSWPFSAFQANATIIVIFVQPFVGPWPLFRFNDPRHSR
jgi:hypothetical protein